MTRFKETGVEFDDGAFLPADVVVLATGFRTNLRDDVRELLGSSVADQIDDFWGVDDEGELKGIGRPCGRMLTSNVPSLLVLTYHSDPALMLFGGTLGIMRYYSRFIALQIKAALVGTPLHIYDRKFPIRTADDGSNIVNAV